MKPYMILPGSTVDRVLKAIDAAAVPMNSRLLREAIEHVGNSHQFHALLRRPIDLGVINLTNRLYSRGETPTQVRERRVGHVTPDKHTWRSRLPEPSALEGSLRTLLTDGASVATGDPLRALANALDAAREVLAARAGTRFKGAEVELLVARELRSITVAANLATVTLKQALEVLQ